VQFVRSSQFVPDAAEGDQVISPYAVAALILGLGFRLVELHGAATVREEEEKSLARSYILFGASVGFLT
jgi:hypothetical protein